MGDQVVIGLDIGGTNILLDCPRITVHGIGTIGSGVIVRSIMSAVAFTDGIRIEAVYSRSETTGWELADASGRGTGPTRQM